MAGDAFRVGALTFGGRECELRDLGAAAAAGLPAVMRRGDVLLSVGGTAVASAAEAARLVDAARVASPRGSVELVLRSSAS